MIFKYSDNGVSNNSTRIVEQQAFLVLRELLWDTLLECRF